MLYFDLKVDDTVIWTGTVCMINVGIKPDWYIPFDGDFIFIDQLIPSVDPTWNELDLQIGRFSLYYVDAESNFHLMPLIAAPSQTFDIVLGEQNCTISIYEKATDNESFFNSVA